MREAVQHSLVYTAANLASRGAFVVALIVLPFLLTPAQYGALGLIATIAAFVNVIVPLEVSQGLARYYATASPDERGRLAGSAWWFSVAMLAVAAAITLAAAAPAARWLFGSEDYAAMLRIAVAYFAANTLVLFLQNQCRWEFRIRDYVWISIGFAAATLLLSVTLALAWPDALLGALTGQALGGALVVSFGVVRLRTILFHRLNLPDLKRMLRFALPLVPASIALAVGTYAGRLILNAYASLDEVGLFTFASQLATMPSLTILGVQAALTPLIMARFAEPDTPPAIARLFEGFVGLAGVACAGFGLFAEPLVALAGNRTYLHAGPLVMLLAPGLLAFQAYIFAPGFAIALRTKLQLFVTIVTVAAGCALAVPLVAAFGATGAAASVLIGGLIFAICWFAVSQRLYPVPFRTGRLLAFAGLWAAVGWLSAILPGTLDWAPLAARVALLGLLAASVLAFRLIEPSALRRTWLAARTRWRTPAGTGGAVL